MGGRKGKGGGGKEKGGREGGERGGRKGISEQEGVNERKFRNEKLEKKIKEQ